MYGELLAALDSGATVITANKRLTRTLRRAHEQHRQAQGDIAWPTPDILSWPHWLQRLWQESRLRSGAALTQTLLEDAAVDLIWQQCIAEAEQHRAAVPVTQLARQARKAWKLVNDWQAITAEEWVSAGLSPDQQAFVRWSGAYRERCEQANWIDQEQLPGALQKDIAAGLFDDLAPLRLAGFDELTPLMQEFFATLQARGISTTAAEAGSVTGNLLASPCRTQDAELLAAARWARSRIEQTPDAAIGVVIPDLGARAATVRRTFLDIFAPDWRVAGIPAGLPLDVSYGRPLAELPIIHAALSVIRLSSGSATFNDLSLLLRSPWFKGAAAEATARAQLDIRWRDKLRIEVALPELLPNSLKHAPQFAAMVQELIARSHDRQQRSAYEWTEWLTDLLTNVGWAADGAHDSETWQALESWSDLLGVFARSGAVLKLISRQDALGSLMHLAQQRLFQPEGSEHGVKVLGVLEAAGHQYDALWIAGMAREIWPPVSRPDPFIPLRLQRRLQMPDSSAGRVLDYTRMLTERLMTSGTDVVISWPQELDGEPVSPSGLIGDLAATGGPEAALWPAWNQHAQQAGRTELLDNDPPPPLAKITVRGGASVLNRQAVSPLNAFIEKRLGAAEMRQPVAGISAMDKGNLTHKALELFYAKTPYQSGIAAMSPEERRLNLQGALAAALQSLSLPDSPFMRTIGAFEIAQQLGRLENFVAVDLERPDFKLKEWEQLHEVRIGPLQLSLKLDRLDELGDGSEIVIDYKTGSVNRQSWNPAKPRDLQLPLYVITRVPEAAAVAFARIAAQGSSYEGVGDAGTDIIGVRAPGAGRGEVKFLYPQSDEVIESWEDLRAAWGELLLTLAEQFAAGDFRLDPRNPDSATGQFAILSRIYDEGIGLYEDDA